MIRPNRALVVVALVLLVCLSFVGAGFLPRELTAGVPGGAIVKPPLAVRSPAPTVGPVTPATIATILAGSSTVAVDVGLNDDGRFQGAGELAYAQGQFGGDG